jgi:hypothetical protein
VVDLPTFNDVARRLINEKDNALKATCTQQVLFYRLVGSEKKAISLNESVSEYVGRMNEPPILFESMSVDIYVAEVHPDGEPTGEFELRTITTDRELQNGFVRAGANGSPISRKMTIYHLHELQELQRYLALPPERYFNGWQLKESAIMEEEIGRAILAYFESQGLQLRAVTRKIMDARNLPVQEWDAVFYDDENKHLYLAEAKHDMRLRDIHKVTTKVSVINEVIQNTKNPEFKTIRPSSITVVLASGCLLTGDQLSEAQSRGYLLCYPSGDRYCVQPSSP